MRRWVVGAAFVAACGNSYTLDNGSTADAGAPAADGGVTSADAAPTPAGCDVNADGRDALACAADEFALFVDPASRDGDGTREKPVSAINEALARVASTGKQRIYICGTAPFPEHLSITATNAARLIGGFACGTWQPSSGSVATIAPIDPGLALNVTGVAAALRFEDIKLVAIGGTPTIRSSITVLVTSSPNVVFKRVTVIANAGQNGEDAPPAFPGSSNPGNRSGLDAVGARGGAEAQCGCTTGGITIGGEGGDVTGTTAGEMGFPPTILSGGQGQSQSTCIATGAPASDGANGGPGSDAPAPPFGTLSADGWLEGSSTAGTGGGVGQGGGGGGSNNGMVSGGGGSGGCGGCGGGGGFNGKTGGSSIAILAFDSPIQLDTCSISAAKGGYGGNGGLGVSGAAGGSAGKGSQTGCAGGAGGQGGMGGDGAGGAGGLSVGVLYAGALPVNSGSTIAVTAPGSGGAGAGADNDGPNGLVGEIIPAP